MGIAPYKYFTFDGESSRNYDVYLTGTGVFNAPQRAVDLLEIPGRNGNYALDQGRFNNITVTYKAGIVDYSESNFADKVSAVRNWLCSKVGYVRLTDDYNPDEYRMAVFKNGITVDHDDLKTGEFDITFECKPQRWLTSGETATAVANNGTLSNPTPFEAEPLLAVKGYGDINIGSNSINIASVPLGEIVIYGNEADYTALTRTVTLDVSRLNSADTIAVSCVFDTRIKTKGSMWYISNFATGTETDCSSYWVKTGSTQYDMFITPTGLDFAKGTSSTETCTLALTIGTNGTYYSRTITCSVAYDGDDTLTLSASIDSATPGINFYKYAKMQETTADSTMSALGNPMYIDLDIGEAWNEDSGEPVSVNNAVTLPSDLPKLPPGATAFTYDGTVTELKVTPRWWKV